MLSIVPGGFLSGVASMSLSCLRHLGYSPSLPGTNSIAQRRFFSATLKTDLCGTIFSAATVLEAVKMYSMLAARPRCHQSCLRRLRMLLRYTWAFMDRCRACGSCSVNVSRLLLDMLGKTCVVVQLCNSIDFGCCWVLLHCYPQRFGLLPNFTCSAFKGNWCR